MREWLVTNGLGGYASLTRRQQNTRKYHGLLVASLQPPTKRWVFVSNLYEYIVRHDVTTPITHQPNSFSFTTFPHFQYNHEDIRITKTPFMPHEHNTTILRYKISTSHPFTLRLFPVITARHIYDVWYAQTPPYNQEPKKDQVTIHYDHVDTNLLMQVPKATYTPLESICGIDYPKEIERGDSHHDTLAKPGVFDIRITKPTSLFVILTTENVPSTNPEHLYQKERKRKNDLLTQAQLVDEQKKLVLATDQFMVKRNKNTSIIAGYHWFSDWGRDTLISLPGITLVTKRFSEAKDILKTFARYEKHGLIPNVFMDRDDAVAYNTVDAPLWFIDRVFQYIKYTNDLSLLTSLWKPMNNIIQGYSKGTEYNIHMNEDGLINHGPGLTWMDVKVGDHYPTPRAQQAVEIQALWYNALCIMSQCADLLNKDDDFSSTADKIQETMMNEYTQLYDLLDARDTSIRPNMVFLASLDYSPVNTKIQQNIVSTIQNHLITPFGLRSLTPDDAAYLGTYLGEHHRDQAYHNGTVWTWLLGPFITAYVKTQKRSLKARHKAYEEYIAPMLHIFGDLWDGSIAEIFDGDPPFIPRGCMHQAWSVAEVLRCWVEDIHNIRPPYEQSLLHKIRV